MKRLGSIFAITMLFSAFAVSVGSPAGWAGSRTVTVDFGTLESVARASSGDTVKISGSGTFSLHPKSINGDGDLVQAAFGPIPRTFTHRDAGGNVLAEGTWEPTAVLSYRSYGPATEEQNAFFGGLPEGSEGGKVKMKVALFVDGVQVHDGILTIVCELGQPPKNSVEKTLLLVQDTPFNFNEVVSGDNIFIRH